ncbi:hypothetical protein BN938_1838 [Mucinivorans hirudinis]|uniref:Uncharacterized protein n=1 Tax=Mucinivorans hirudinis TaxID=1433126 RepID=A0A060RD58_9BACT|nr:hypothetical protein BN938_1838 [Mucinivorans hirudinis]
MIVDLCKIFFDFSENIKPLVNVCSILFEIAYNYGKRHTNF